MAKEERLICQSSDLVSGGVGVRFDVERTDGEKAPGFVIRYKDDAHAYINRCAHIQVELDWQHGQFFDDDEQFLICATHGAIYSPDLGVCVAGPCKGQRLEKLVIEEKGGKIFLLSE